MERLLVGLLCGLTSLAVPIAGAGPHVVMVLTDDLGWGAPGYQNSRIQSPSLDRLAHSGLILTRHYTYRYCAPTVPLSPGRARARWAAGGIAHCLPDGTDLRYTMIPQKLAGPGLVSHHIGKWHQGFHTAGFTPAGRGFNTSFGFLQGGEDHWTSRQGQCSGRPNVDLSFGANNGSHVEWAPAIGMNGTGPGDDQHYTGYLFARHAVKTIREHDPSKSLFIYLALHNTHAPVEAPASFVAAYNASGFCEREQNFNAQVSFVDQAVANVTAALKSAGLWKDTLLVWTTDNGAPVNSAGSNYPLKGGKGSLWEGGYRTPAFVNGGLLPDAMRGRSLDGLVHVSDWYASFAALHNKDPRDPGGPAPVDGLDVLPYLFGSADSSPRKEIVHDHLMHCVPDGRQSLEQCKKGQTPDFPAGHYPNHTTGALTQQAPDGKLWKLLVGPAQQASWFGRFSPNGTLKPFPSYDSWVDCAPPRPCLYELVSDESEHRDLSREQPRVLERMLERFKQIEGEYHPPKNNPPDDTQGYCAAVRATGGYVAPD